MYFDEKLAHGSRVSDFFQITEESGERNSGNCAYLIPAAVVDKEGIIAEYHTTREDDIINMAKTFIHQLRFE